MKANATSDRTLKRDNFLVNHAMGLQSRQKTIIGMISMIIFGAVANEQQLDRGKILVISKDEKTVI